MDIGYTTPYFHQNNSLPFSAKKHWEETMMYLIMK